MAVQLEIRDGNPWWLSPDIWTVPGTDPEGTPGVPIAGQPCYLWARVRNNGQDSVQNARVNFYWANPAVGFDRSTATLVGTSFVTLNGDEQSEVLCLNPWVPIFVNEGHECVLAEAFHPTLDPLPNVPAFNVPTDRHVAQRNLHVVVAMKSLFHLAFEIHNPSRREREFTISVQHGKVEEAKPLMSTLGTRNKAPEHEGKLGEIGFVHAACPSADTLNGQLPHSEKMTLRPGERAGLSLVGRVEGGGALLHVVQHDGNNLVGGLSVLVRAEGN